MSSFTPEQLAYLRSQPLGRIATADVAGRPHVTPVAFFYDAADDAIVVSSNADMARTKKFRDAQANPEVAIVVDDVADFDAWKARGIEIRGLAVAHAEGGEEVGRRVGARFTFHPAYLAIHPRYVRAWGIPSAVADRESEPAGSAA